MSRPRHRPLAHVSQVERQARFWIVRCTCGAAAVNQRLGTALELIEHNATREDVA